MVFRKNARGSYLGLLLLLWLLVNDAVRTVLLVMAHRSLDASFAPGTLAVLYFKGALNDLFPYFLLTLPLAALIFLKKNVFGGRVGRTLASLAFWLYACLFLFSAVAETLFWGEFSSRFNFIAVDYLIYTTEVIRNIRESYPVIPLLSAVAACAAVLTVPAMLLLWKKAARPAQRSPALLAGCLAMACATFFYAPLSSPDRVERELAANGVWSLFSAYRHNALDYREFYPVMDAEKASLLVRGETGGAHFSKETGIVRDIAATRPSWHPNVVQIAVESLGSNLLGENTPNLNRIIGQSLFFSRLYATGTRTVRGIEALTLSLPPTPGSSIVRRPGCEGLFSTGSVFRAHGYDTAFIYGGFGYFDNMNAFFSGNGFRIVDRAVMKSDDITFTNAWGVCDEDLFRTALLEADEDYRQGRPFYQFVLTTSNHRPFTYPEGRVSQPSGSGRAGAVAYTDYALGRFFREASRRPWFSNTVFVLCGDHTSSAAGHTDLPPERYLIPAFLYSPGNIAPETVTTLCSQADIAPTLFDVLGWSYRSPFFGRSILSLRPEEGRAWISTYQALGRLDEGGLAVLEPVRRSSACAWTQKEGLGPELHGEEAETRLNLAIAEYQLASDMFTQGALREENLAPGQEEETVSL